MTQEAFANSALPISLEAPSFRTLQHSLQRRVVTLFKGYIRIFVNLSRMVLSASLEERSG